MKEAAAKIEALPLSDIVKIVSGGSVLINVAGAIVAVDQETVEIRRSEKPGLKVLNEGTLTLALDTVITPTLLREGYVRDLIRGVQNLRKESGLEVTDRITLALGGDSELKCALDDFREFVASETLAQEILWTDSPNVEAVMIEAGERTWSISVSKR
jgi:isoleucyl-tRNA synthetase